MAPTTECFTEVKVKRRALVPLRFSKEIMVNCVQPFCPMKKLLSSTDSDDNIEKLQSLDERERKKKLMNTFWLSCPFFQVFLLLGIDRLLA